MTRKSSTGFNRMHNEGGSNPLAEFENLQPKKEGFPELGLSVRNERAILNKGITTLKLKSKQLPDGILEGSTIELIGEQGRYKARVISIETTKEGVWEVEVKKLNL